MGKTNKNEKPERRGSTIYWPVDLLRRAKIQCILQDRELSELVCTAVEEYLGEILSWGVEDDGCQS